MRHFTLILATAAVAELVAVGCHETSDNGDGSVSLHSEVEMTLPAAETQSFPLPLPLTGPLRSRTGNG